MIWLSGGQVFVTRSDQMTSGVLQSSPVSTLLFQKDEEVSLPQQTHSSKHIKIQIKDTENKASKNQY